MNISKRYAQVERNVCVACGACAVQCPRDAISIWKGCYAFVNTDICIGCGKCAVACPTESIKLQDRKEKSNEQ